LVDKSDAEGRTGDLNVTARKEEKKEIKGEYRDKG